MQSVKRIASAVAVALMASAGIAAQASAEEFVVSKTGQLKGKALNTQIFTVKAGGGKVECTESEEKGEIAELKSTERKVSRTLRNCKIFGLGSATATLIDRTLFTNPRGVSILVVNVDYLSGIFIKCHYLLRFAETFTKAGEVEYKNLAGGKIEVQEKLTGVESEVTESESEALCGKVGEKSTTGTYTGNSEIELEGGTIEVK